MFSLIILQYRHQYVNVMLIILQQVYDFVQLKGVFYSGSHGMDTMGPALRNNNYDANFQKRTFDTEVTYAKIFIIFIY